MTFEEYVKLASSTEGFGSGAAAAGLAPDMPVWAVLLRGTVRLSLPGAPPYEERLYDNLTVVLNARTGEVFRTNAYVPGRTPPLAAWPGQ